MFALLEGSALVVGLFATGDADLHFDVPIFEVEGEGDESETFLCREISKLFDLALVQEEFSFASLFVIKDAAHTVG